MRANHFEHPYSDIQCEYLSLSGPVLTQLSPTVANQFNVVLIGNPLLENVGDVSDMSC